MALPRIGTMIMTPRFLNVTIREVFDSYDDMIKAGYTEPTHYRGDFWVNGKVTGEYSMRFAASPNPKWHKPAKKSEPHPFGL